MNDHAIPEPGSIPWFESERLRLLAFPRGARPPAGGSYWLGDDGDPWHVIPLQAWATARMAYVDSLAVLEGADTAGRAGHALRGFTTGPLRDAVHDGWFDTAPQATTAKSAYTHAFVVLGAAAATAAGIPDAAELLDDSLAIVERRFWEEEHGLALDERSGDWSETSPYRGLNANMHLAEAYLTAAALGRPELGDRVIAICRRVAGWASENDWRIPEHFDARWAPQLDYNAERPHDPFKPYGSTPGHSFEWARIMMQTATTSAADRGWLTEAAIALYGRARADGWGRDGEDGFVYTVDWSGVPQCDQHLAWVAAEATAAATALAPALDTRDDLRVWWRYIGDHLVDRVRGSWIHELDRSNRPASTIWPGKPDLYHAYQACTIPRFPLTSSVLRAVMGASAPATAPAVPVSP